jgi:hypothetical protein
LEVVRTAEVPSLAAVLDAVVPRAFASAEADQVSGGGSNPRFGSVFAEPPAEVVTSPGGSCAIVSDRPALASALRAALGARGVGCTVVPAASVGAGFEGAARCLSDTPVDSVVVALAGTSRPSGTEPWAQVLSEHAGIVGALRDDAGWVRAVADHASGSQRPVRLLTITDASTTGGRSRAQAVAQLSRVARSATEDRVAMFAVGHEAGDDVTGVSELAAHLLCAPEATALSGAELVAGSGWVGLRSHPRAAGSITLGEAGIPEWFDTALRGVL